MELEHRIEYRLLAPEDFQPSLLDHFERHQEVQRVWRDIDGIPTLIESPFNEEWNTEQKQALVEYHFPKTLEIGGCVIAASDNGELIAFAALVPPLFGSELQYLRLMSLHVSFGYREMGIGTRLFRLCKEEARKLGAKKIYISGHSAEETQAFYKAMGCRPATEVDQSATEKEPCDIQLECEI